MERKGIIAAGNMLVDHVHQIVQWPERGWLAEITHSERSTGGAPLNVLLTLAKMHTGLPLQAVGLIGQDADGDYIMAMLEQYHVNRQHVQRTTFAPTSMSQVMTDPSGQRTFFHSPGANRLLDLPAFADKLQSDTDFDYVVIGDKNSIRLYHPNPEKIGYPMQFTKPGALENGESYFITGKGSIGMAMRAKTPIFDDDGNG